MTNIWKGIAVLGLIVGAVALYLSFPVSAPSNSFGAAPGVKLAENYDPYLRYNGGFYTALPFKTTSNFQLGSSGTNQSNQITTTCSPIADVSIGTTTPGYAYCTGVTGVTSSDTVLAQFSTSTAGFVAGKDSFFIITAKASTTAGAIDFEVANLTGTAQVPSAAGRAASTTVIWAAH